jgi:hypothetical protein
MDKIICTCGVEIHKLLTKNGKRMPVRADSVQLDSDGKLPTHYDPGVGHKSHFADCPDADKHRQPRTNEWMKSWKPGKSR